MKNTISCLLLAGAIFAANANAAIPKTKLFHSFVDKMVSEHNFNPNEIKLWLADVEIKDSILKAISRPAEGLAWYKYRKIFLTPSRIQGGVQFWHQHNAALADAEQKYGVPASIITAIIGVETRYGSNTGSYRVIDALATLGFAYPKRAKFFLKELENFFILCREQKINPLEPTGSYAGAMGIPQFMPSSFRNFAADAEDDGKKDIWNNPADAIASAANYFAKHQWRTGGGVAFPASSRGQDFRTALNKDLKPSLTWAQLQALKITVEHDIAPSEKVKLLSYQQEDGEDLWVGLHNFYVITRYNHSPLYAMAVFQLSEEIKKHKRLH